MFSPLRAAVARTRALNVSPSLSASFHRTFTTHANGPKPDRAKRTSLPNGPFMDNAPGWNEDLATPSEAFVKADRERAQSVDEMQKKTVDYVQAHHDPEAGQTQASYAREEVGGPLGNAAGMGEFEGVVGNDDLGPDAVQVEADGRVVSRRVGSEKTTASDGL